MNVIVACEFSGVVRDAFLARGHNAISCDLLPTERPGPHMQADIKAVDLSTYDLMIAHPPCTRLATSGARWFAQYEDEQKEALEFVRWLLDAPVNRIALENPVGIIGTHVRPIDQMIQPWMFGHGEKKATCLWLKNLPRLRATSVVDGRNDRIWRSLTKKDRGKERSRTYQGIADAMAEQWGALPAYSIEPDGQLSFL